MSVNRDWKKVRKKLNKMNSILLVNALIISMISGITIFSATHNRTMSFVYKDIMWLGIGIVVYFIFSMIDYKFYQRNAKVIYAINVISLLSVFLFGVSRLGAKRWINLGFMTLQPSEFSKIFIVLTFGVVLSEKYKLKFSGIKDVGTSFIHVFIIFILIMKQPDLGTSLTLIAIFSVMIFIHGIDRKTIAWILGGAGVFIPFAYFFILKSYQKTRVLTFLNPEKDLLGSGWNVTQSKIAVGSGGLLGKGLFQGTQSKLRFLPESHTDFIGAVFFEEAGFIGAVFLIGLYFYLIYNIVKIGEGAKDEYGKLVCYGIAAIMFFHTTVNIGMIIGVMPVTGLPLLLMSYGGSSYIFTFMMLGIVQSIRIHNEKY